MSEAGRGPEPDGGARAPAPRSRLVVVVRVLLLLAAAGAGIAGFSLLRRGGNSAVRGAAYACPMHPKVTSTAPGSCPICKMALETLRPGAAAPSGSAVGAAPLFGIKTVVPRAFRREVIAPAVIDEAGEGTAILYPDEIAALPAKVGGSFQPGAAPAASVPIRLAGDAPQLWDESTVRVRFRVEAARPAPAPGTTGWLSLPDTSVPTLAVPEFAVLHGSAGPTLLVPDGAGGFRERPVKTGRTFSGLTAIASGLSAGEPIVVERAFFADAERRLRGEPAPAATEAR